MDMKKIRRDAAKAVEQAGGTSSLKSDAQDSATGPGRSPGAKRSSAAALFKGPAKSGAGGKRSQHR